MTTLHAVKLALISAAAAAVAVALPSPAQAESSFQFISPTGDVACQMGEGNDGVAYAWCRVQNPYWPEPIGDCQAANVPGAIDGADGTDFQLRAGAEPCNGFVMSQIFFEGPYLPQALPYGETREIGTITCESAESGVKCTDSSTIHSFLVSPDMYVMT